MGVNGRVLVTNGVDKRIEMRSTCRPWRKGSDGIPTRVVMMEVTGSNTHTGARFEVGSISTVKDLEGISSFLQECRSSGQRCELDFSPLLSAKSVRAEPGLMDWVGNLVQASYPDVPLTIRIPAGGMGPSARSGLLWTAILREPGSTDIQLVDEDALTTDVDIGFREMESRLASVSARLAPVTTGTGFVIRDPHRSWGRITPIAFQRAITAAIGQLLSNARIAIRQSALDELARVSSGVLVHLVDNVRDHAFTPSPSNRTTLPHERLHCRIQGSLTRGGGGSSFNRLHLQVVDFGFGLLSTLRPKLVAKEDAFSVTPGQIIMRRLLRKELPSYGRASNIYGYPEIVSMLTDYGGKLSIRTPSDTDDLTLTVIRAFPGDNVPYRDTRVRISENANSALPFIGTTVHVTLAAPTAS